MTTPAEQLRARRGRVETLLWAWAEHLQMPAAVTGHAATSPSYRMMQQAQPGASARSRSCGPWQGRQRRRDGELSVAPAGTCYGRETRAEKTDDITQPEIDADRMGPPVRMITHIVATFPAYQRDILFLRYVERVRDFRQIAAIMRGQADERAYPASSCTQHAVATLYKQALDHIYRLRFEMPAPARRSIMPELIAGC